MATRIAEEVYERYVKALPAAERLRLLALVADDLASPPADPAPRAKRSVMELHGLASETWKGVDPDAYVEHLRGDWDERG
jgi:hypothetical protein